MYMSNILDILDIVIIYTLQIYRNGEAMESRLPVTDAKYGFSLTDEMRRVAETAFPVRADNPVPDRDNSAYFLRRIPPFRTFAERLTKDLAAYDAQLRVSAELEVDEGEAAVVLSFGGKEYRIPDTLPDLREPMQSTHQRNAAFMLSTKAAVGALGAELTAKFPELGETVDARIKTLATRCSDNCHALLRRARRTEVWQEGVKRRRGMDTSPA